MSMMNEDFQDILRELSGADARFLIVGAYAVAVHGRPRATGDLDIWIEATPENGAKVYQALRSFGAPLHDLSVSDLSKPGVTFQIGLPPRRIDILTHIDGVDFHIAWENRLSTRFGDVDCHSIGKEELIQNKRASSRPKDLADIAELEALKP